MDISERTYRQFKQNIQRVAKEYIDSLKRTYRQFKKYIQSVKKIQRVP